MPRDGTFRPEMVWWDYGPGPSALDLAGNGTLSRAVRIVVHLLLRAYLRVFHGFRPAARERLGRLRGCLIVANHTSHLDALVLAAALPLNRVNRIRSLCAKDYFFAHPAKRTVAFLLANTIPMERDRFDRAAVAFCRKRLAEGDNIILFPEGTRSPDGRIGPFKGGVGLLALRYGLPVVPALIRGAHACCRKGAAVPQPGRIEITFGRTVRYRGMPNRKAAWILIAQDLQRRVRELSAQPEQERENEYGPDQDDEDARPHARAPERRRSHRLRGRVHLGQDGGLRLPKPAVGHRAAREAV